VGGGVRGMFLGSRVGRECEGFATCCVLSSSEFGNSYEAASCDG
jgi:hypothetical protein